MYFPRFRFFARILIGILCVTATVGMNVHPVFAADPTVTTVGGASLSLPAKAVSIAVSGNYAYLAFQTAGDIGGTNSFRIIDVTDPANPSIKGGSGLNFTRQAQAVAVQGNYAYVVIGSSGAGKMIIIDISNPDAPAFVSGGSVDLPSSPRSIAVSGNYAYIGMSTMDPAQMFSIVDVSTVTAPAIVGGSGIVLPYSISQGSLAVSGNYVYVGIGQETTGTDGFRVIDVSNHAAPVIVGGAALSVPGNAFGSIAYRSGYVYVAFTNSLTTTDAFRIIDVSSPATPVVVGGTAVSLSPGGIGVGLVGNYAIVGQSDFDTINQFTVVNVTSPTAPTVTGVTVAAPGLAVVIASSGNYAYMHFFHAASGTDTFWIEQVTAAAASGGNSADYTPPDAPTKLVGTSDGVQVKLTWSDPTAADLSRIDILRNTGGSSPIDGGTPIDVVRSGVRTVTDTLVQPGQTYQYQLRAKDSAGNASVSEIVTVKVESPVVVITPTQIVPSAPVATPQPISSVVTIEPYSAKEDFLKNGTLATQSLGSGERDVFWREFTELHGREPSVAELDLIANGQIHERDIALEKKQLPAVLPIWQKITGKKSVTGLSTREQQMYDTMIYRLRFPREMKQEQAGLTKFINRVGRLPKTPTDWAAVRALGYIQ